MRARGVTHTKDTVKTTPVAHAGSSKTLARGTQSHLGPAIDHVAHQHVNVGGFELPKRVGQRLPEGIHLHGRNRPEYCSDNSGEIVNAFDLRQQIELPSVALPDASEDGVMLDVGVDGHAHMQVLRQLRLSHRITGRLV